MDAQAGAAGAIQVTATAISLTDGAQINSTTFGPGPGGPITLTVTKALTLAGTNPDGRFPSAIFAQAQGMDAQAGAAGAIQVTAAALSLTEGAQISSTTSGPGPGGPITLTVTDALTLAGTNREGSPSGIFAQARGEETTAGQRARSR